jgi:YVTN family beta-propeller protein
VISGTSRRVAPAGTGLVHRRTLTVALVAGTLVSAMVSFGAPMGAAATAAPTGWFAYVANWTSGTVMPVNLDTNTADTAINIGGPLSAIVMTPDGATAYVLNTGGTVVPIYTSTNTAGTPIPVGRTAYGMAIAPDGKTIYVTSEGIDASAVTRINTSTKAVESPIQVGAGTYAIAITPDGNTAYVSDQNDSSVIPINLETNVAETPISVGSDPNGLAITPDGATLFVASYYSNEVTPIDTATNTAGSPIPVGAAPTNIAITPNGATAYVTDTSGNEVTPINIAARTAGTPIPMGGDAQGVAITPDGATAYVSGFGSTVTPIDIATGTPGVPITVGMGADGIAITPDQAPIARLFLSGSALGIPTDLDASDSTVAFGSIASYAWTFGDGTAATTTTPTTTHTYAALGTYTAAVTETSSAGTSTTTTYTGQTISQNGGPSAHASQPVTIVAPGAYTALSPFRVCDTRAVLPANQCTGHTLNSDRSVDVQVTAKTGPLGQSVPVDALAVALNVTALDESTANSFISVFPAGDPLPRVSNISIDAGATQANLVVVRLGAGGDVSVYNSVGRSDVVVDVEGYFAPPGTAPVAGEYHSMPPLRICDTRARKGTECAASLDHPLLGGTWRDAVLSGLPSGAGVQTPSIPTHGAAAAVFDLTVANATKATYVTVATPNPTTDACPTGAPAASNLNPPAGSALPNRVITALGPHQDVCVYNAAGSIDFIVDINGWFGDGTEGTTDPRGALFYSIPPARICDTRPTKNGSFADCQNELLGPNSDTAIQAAGKSLVPPVAGSTPPLAIVANLTAVAGTVTTYFTLFQCEGTQPLASDLNARAGDVVANLAFVEVSQTGISAGNVCLYNAQGTTNAILDVAGWFQ